MESKMVSNGIEYVCIGDYYIPDLKLPNEDRSIGKYGRMHRDYLRENNPVMFDDPSEPDRRTSLGYAP